MAEPANHTLAYLRRLEEKFDRLHSEVGELRTEVGERFDRVEARLGGIEDELLVLNGIALRLEGREVETTGLKALFDRHERRLAELEGSKRDDGGHPGSKSKSSDTHSRFGAARGSCRSASVTNSFGVTTISARRSRRFRMRTRWSMVKRSRSILQMREMSAR